MARKNKSFDCVAMKSDIQERHMAEYERRKEEFASYLAFVNARVNQSDFAKTMREKIARGRVKAAS